MGKARREAEGPAYLVDPPNPLGHFSNDLRWSAEYMDCAMPAVLDTYSICGYGCIYCFSLFQKIGNMHPTLRWVDPRLIAEKFTNVDTGQFGPFLKARFPVQWGGLSDPFCKNEQKFGVSLGLLRFFQEIAYPISMSTKGAWIKDDPRYMDLLRAGRDNFHLKVSIICLDRDKAARVEFGVPSPEERLGLIAAASKAGVYSTLRLRPFIPGISDRDYIELVRRAAGAGAKNVSFETMCLELRQAKRLASGYRKMSDLAGRDLVAFYRRFSGGAGYLRLNRAVVLPIVEPLAEACDKLGLDLLVSDAHAKDFSRYPACCGIPPSWKRVDKNFLGALLKARDSGKSVTWSGTCGAGVHPFGHVHGYNAHGFNTKGNVFRAFLGHDKTLVDVMHFAWNDPSRATSPQGYFRCMAACGRDKCGDIIYRYEPNGRTYPVPSQGKGKARRSPRAGKRQA